MLGYINTIIQCARKFCLKIRQEHVLKIIRSFVLEITKAAKAWEPNSAATFCGQLHKQTSAQGHNNNKSLSCG